MRLRHTTLVIVLDSVALGAAAGALVVALGLPLAARQSLGPGAVLTVGAGVGFLVALAAAALLLRSVGRAVDRMLAAAEAFGNGATGELPLLAPPGESAVRGLSGAAIAFERLAAALSDERRRLAIKVSELERANRDLAGARESWLRSERLATVGRLAAGVAHEVGNPLGAIAGYAELARTRLEAGAAPPAELADLLARISGEAARIDAIIRDLLDFARPADLALAPVSLARAVEGAVRLARMQPRFRAVEVAVDLPADLPKVRADERRVGQVLLNLLLNAGDAMEGAGAVRVGARTEGDHVRVEVADRGPGILPEHLPRLFDPFFTTKSPGNGTGLGLAVCHGIVESLGGDIRAGNAPGGGAVFTVRLRAWPGAGDEAAKDAVLR